MRLLVACHNSGLTKETAICGKFAVLQWEERIGLLQGMKANGSDAPSQWARCTFDISDQTRNRNRYEHLTPYKENRVKLKVPEDHNDYINASPIILESTRSKTTTKFIAVQVCLFFD
jgi:protein-tyrosine phosphatase